MSLPRRVSEILAERVELEVESIDRLYLNAYVPGLQWDRGVVKFFRQHRGERVVSSVLMGRMTRAFVASIEAFVRREGLALVSFRKGQRKDDVARDYRRHFEGEEGLLFVGKAQEKASVFRTEKRRDPAGERYPWIVRSTAMVNAYYFYGMDRDFGPFFLKFCSYFPYTAKLCLNGHEYLKRQLEKEGIAYEALDNGILCCQDPQRLQEIADGLSAEKIDAFFRTWLSRLPHPFAAEDREAGYRYDLSILQAEFSFTQVLTPSLYVDYKSTRTKQYHKEGRALRTEATTRQSCASLFTPGPRLHAKHVGGVEMGGVGLIAFSRRHTAGKAGGRGAEKIFTSR